MSDPTERFRVLRSLGRGGFGEVQLVYDTERQQQVALKRLHLDGAGSHAPLRREFRVLSALPHPNIVALHELHIDGDGAFFTMEPIEGVDAVSWVRPVEGLGRLAAVKRLCAQIIDALDAMHGKGVLHRDLKPANVLVTPAGRAVLLDAGLAAPLSEGGTSLRVPYPRRPTAPSRPASAGPGNLSTRRSRRPVSPRPPHRRSRSRDTSCWRCRCSTRRRSPGRG